MSTSSNIIPSCASAYGGQASSSIAEHNAERTRVMSSHSVTRQDIAKAFKRKSGLLEVDPHFCEFDISPLLTMYHQPSTTPAARTATIAAMFHTAMTNGLLLNTRRFRAKEALSKWNQEEEYRSSHQWQAVKHHFGLSGVNDEKALKVLRWQFKESANPKDPGSPSDYCKEMFTIDLTQHVCDTIYQGFPNSRAPSVLPKEALEECPETIHPWVRARWKSRSGIYHPDAYPKLRSNLLLVDSLTRGTLFSDWDHARDQDPDNWRRDDDQKNDAISPGGAQLPPHGNLPSANMSDMTISDGGLAHREEPETSNYLGSGEDWSPKDNKHNNFGPNDLNLDIKPSAPSHPARYPDPTTESTVTDREEIQNAAKSRLKRTKSPHATCFTSCCPS
ncbi:uncharacterized protein I206_104594 [Kwoniella pini CBS 10737]|uniref:Uncharacterized protein n=1 Tax=Kwoniella pini CBS 10737 TaxID=1296096 RepID=A0A1B9I7C5_9TREE|nr:uncharacterized protein I206_02128 [Kwoniella pini CBS 10737]OCF51414.1 hypothetical protein I206_02128 [Kwoniella pini CBS 10737]